MDENISIKYAVYIKKDGNDSVEVVRDTVEQAKADMENLKKKESYVRIDKANIKNFSKDDEKVVSSETITSWDSPENKTGSNNSQSFSGQEPSSFGGNNIPASPIIPIPSNIPTPAPVEPKVETWQEYYGRKGALIWGEGFEELTKPKEVKVEVKEGDASATPSATPAIPAPNTNPPFTPVSPPSNEIKPEGAPSVIEPQNMSNNSGAAPMSDSDVDRIAQKLKEKLSNGNQPAVNPQPIKA